MVRGKCPACGVQYHGWALVNQAPQYCPKCGSPLEIFLNEEPASSGDGPPFLDKFLLNLHETDKDNKGDHSE